MKTSLLHRYFATLALVCTLGACGGGGSSASTGSTGGSGTSYPSSGAYGWILKATGPTNALKFGLSMVHPTKPTVEYVIEFGSSVVTDARLISSGSVDPAGLRATALQSSALVYIVGGDVRSVPMQADGTAPINHVQRAGSTTACRFLIDAIDNASPQNSRFIVSTAGADGQCGTADDGRAEISLSSTFGVGFTAISGEAPLDVVRDTATLAPRGWIYSRSVSLWTTTPATTFQTRATIAPAVTRIVASTYNGALAEDGVKLSVFGFSGGTAVTENVLDPGITAGSGWQSIGFDSANFYVYRNAGTDFTSTYSVLRISRTAPTATVINSGTGLVSLAAMGTNVLYLTVFGRADNRLLRQPKVGGAAVVTSTATDTLTSMQTSAAGVHEAWRITGVGGTSPTYTIDMVDESGTSLFNAPGGFPLSVVETATRSFDSSESRTAFLFASGYGARAFGDTTLVSYDASARTARTMGTLPGTATFGTDFVFANAVGGPTSQGLAFAARSSNGSVQDAASQVLSFDLNTANSLVATTSVQ